MTQDQALAFALIGATVAAFIWGRFRYDLVALCALGGGVALGLIPAAEAFSGLSNDITVIIAAALVVSAAIARSGLIEAVLRPFLPRLQSPRTQVPFLVGAVTLLSMVTKNVGALAIMMPTALQLARRTGSPAAWLLMPMAFGSLLGGTVTLVGTSPNIIVSQVREELLGRPFSMYDYAPVGLALSAAGVLFLAIAYRLLPASRKGAAGLEDVLADKAYATEVLVPVDWPIEDRSVEHLVALTEGEARIAALIRGGKRHADPDKSEEIQAGDTLLVEGDPAALDRLVKRGKVVLVGAERPLATEEPTEEVRVVEAVVAPDSSLIGRSAARTQLNAAHGVNLLGVSRSGHRHLRELGKVRLRAGDVLLLQGGERALPVVLQTFGLLPLAEREVRLGDIRNLVVPALILAAAMIAVAFGAVSVAIAFFAAAVLMVVAGAIPMREAYNALDGPVLVLIAALIPVSGTIEATGGAELIGGWLSAVFRDQAPILALGAAMAVAMAATPFLNNAATVLIVAPVGAAFAGRLGLNPDPFLMAVAVGAACDFLTPIGHQCNTLVLGPGGYRFADYARLGAPLSLLVLLAGTPLIAMVWPLTPS